MQYKLKYFDAHHLDNFLNPDAGIGGVSYVFANLDQDDLFRNEPENVFLTKLTYWLPL